MKFELKFRVVGRLESGSTFPEMEVFCQASTQRCHQSFLLATTTPVHNNNHALLSSLINVLPVAL